MRIWLSSIAIVAATAVELVAAAAPIGTSCAQVGDCDSGFCADGVCCDRICNGLCESCLASQKQSGLGTGTCGPVHAGTDPADECAAEPRTTCGLTGNCTGIGAACAQWPLGTPCHDPVDTECQVNTVIGWICNGLGTCYDEAKKDVVCGGGDYLCFTPSGGTPSSSAPEPAACATPCAADTDCDPRRNYRCLGGACVAKLPVGATCSANVDCALGHCADGVCCNDACNSQCEACNLPGFVGTCSQVMGAAPVPPRLPCNGSPPCEGTCNSQRNQCDYPGASTECGTAACVHHSVKLADTCDGAGKCQFGKTTNCGDYSCDPAKLDCFTQCTTSADCAGGPCDTSSGRGACSPAVVSCFDPFSTKDTEGTITACPGGYRCVGDGTCLSKCSGSGDCNTGAGYACGTQQRCILVNDAANDSGPDASVGGTGGTAAVSSGGAPARPDAGSRDGSVGPSSGGITAAHDASTSGVAVAHDSGGCGCRTRGDGSGKRALSTSLMVALAVARLRMRPRPVREIRSRRRPDR